MRKPKVLVVDDKPANHLALAAVLEEDHELRFANSGPEAIDMLVRAPDIDVILMDVHMPEMDGFECALRIKKTERIRDIPIIFVTAVYQDDPFVKRGYEVGGIDYFSKPFDPDILRMKVAAYAGYRLREELLRERELHIRESEELLRVGRKLSAVLESLPVGVLMADIEGRICQSTETAQRILKADPTDGDSYGELVGWWDSAGQMIKEEKGPLARALRSGETTHSEPLSIRCLDGTMKTILASVSPLRGLERRIVGAVVLIRDVTEAKKIEEDLAQRVTKLIGLGVELEESAAR
ncbi:MAG TPA: response regulator [Burkholderiales bacterium]|nr:response regulator [Burkholderiales bacterium]